VHPCRRTITPPYAGKHSAQPSQVSPVRCTERLCRHANDWKCPVVMVSIPLARRHGMCGRVASTRSRSGSEAPEPGPPRLRAGRNRRRRRSATPGMARGERYVSVDRQSKGGVNFSRMTRRRLAAEVSEGLGRSPGPCHTSSASFLSTSHRFAKVAERMPGQLSGDLLDHELSSVERDRVTGALALQLDSDEPRRVVRESRQQQCRDAGHHRKHSATGLLLPSFSKNGATIKTMATG